MLKKVSFGQVASDYAKFRDELPQVIFEQFKQRGVELSGKKVMDLGSGSGIFSRALASQGASVVGIEPERSLIKEAAALDSSQGYNIQYLHSQAEIVDWPDRSQDVITALRAWHWFDRTAVIREVQRLLKPRGHLIVIQSVFVPRLSEVAQQTLQIVKDSGVEVKPAGAMGETKERRCGFPVHWFREWEEAGFQLIDVWEYDYDLSFSIEEWCGKVRTISWMTSVEEAAKNDILTEIKNHLSKCDVLLVIPHQYSVAVLQMP
ncbi:class I SAM-dependent methyltransferase [Paenibacillus sp. J2TS4]|uniref:class I SAM-dependent methyltransferase n=1 Tax=Paenibacillus sp. J2TS4 TaxID=2807194 RepID=UPI001B180B6C|nr:class I SAM-dependent methyltransferase [Paenibacillus sp. J2TS4]GIP32167.1 methyltransferase [Paenibacillus sp. J2TS4]